MQAIIYILHSGNLYGTERMALATMTGLNQQGRGTLLAPPGPVHGEAARLGLDSRSFASVSDLFRALRGALVRHGQYQIVATGVSHSLIAQALAWVRRCRIRHLHVVHGGTDERLSYGRKALLGRLPVTLIAVSAFVRDRLLAHGCREQNISIIENFLPAPPARQRNQGRPGPIKRVAMISRLDPIKRVHLLIEAIERQPAMRDLQFEIFGEGSEFETLRRRAAALPNLILHGFRADAADRLAEFDLLVHTCAEEPFGLAILEAMASGVPVLVPNAGGAGALVDDGRTGFHFPANCSGGLANRLVDLMTLPPASLGQVIDGARHALATRFSPARGLGEYADRLAAPQE